MMPAAVASVPCAIVIFGASGDLARRKLLPALLQLHHDGGLHERTTILGVGRTPLSDADFRDRVGSLPSAKDISREFLERCFFQVVDYEDPDSYEALSSRLALLDRAYTGAARRIFYLATPPESSQNIVERLGESGLAVAHADGWSRVVLEKPFGKDLTSAKRMNDALTGVFKESQIYRIDHYLGKETVQNLLVFRFANAIYEPIWNRNYIDHVQITAAESDGVGHRAGYFDRIGLLRDMVQNHLLQLLCLIAMEPPCTMHECFMRDEKTKVLAAVTPLEGAGRECGVVRGQYSAGQGDGGAVVAYRNEPGVAADSSAETFTALRLEVDNWRWRGVPFYLRAGKRLARRTTEIIVQFKPVPSAVLQPLTTADLRPNRLHFQLQPEEGIQLRFETKSPGPHLRIKTAALRFDYSDTFSGAAPDAYARLLLDVMAGDSTLFLRQDWIEHAWSVLAPILSSWSHDSGDLEFYPAGSSGPAASHQLLAREGREWLSL